MPAQLIIFRMQYGSLDTHSVDMLRVCICLELEEDSVGDSRGRRRGGAEGNIVIGCG